MDQKISILDTTLRDGEQTPGVSFSPSDKLKIAKILLEKVNVDRIEIASSNTTEKDLESVKLITDWAMECGYAERIEALIFSDKTTSLEWLKDCNIQVVNILAKGSEAHCTEQLGKSVHQHGNDILATVFHAKKRGLTCNLYLEDWSRGIQNSPAFVFELLHSLEPCDFSRIYLCDTLGILEPKLTLNVCQQMRDEFPDVEFELHCHNDYQLAVANCLSGLEAGIYGFHATVNGLGERAGNTDLAPLTAAIHDFTSYNTQLNEGMLHEVAELVETLSEKVRSHNSPVTGEDVFTHTSGIHADGQKKAGLYSDKLMPERFGRVWRYALGKLSGRSNVIYYLDEYGIDLTEDQKLAFLVAIRQAAARQEGLNQDVIQRILSAL